MTDISQFYFVSPYPFEASSHAGFPFFVNHLPCFCDNYIIFAPFCQQESAGFRVKYPIRFLCNFTTRILCTIFSLSSWYNFYKHSLVKNVFHNFIHFSTCTRVESGGKGRALCSISLVLDDFRGIQQKGKRSVVAQFHLHICPELHNIL